MNLYQFNVDEALMFNLNGYKIHLTTENGLQNSATVEYNKIIQDKEIQVKDYRIVKVIPTPIRLTNPQQLKKGDLVRFFSDNDDQIELIKTDLDLIYNFRNTYIGYIKKSATNFYTPFYYSPSIPIKWIENEQ